MSINTENFLESGESQTSDKRNENWIFEGDREEKSEGLTGHVWPKSRMLLAIVSKMAKEGIINHQQRGLLKDLIIETDSRIINCLRQYELDGDRKKLYKDCLNLATTAKLGF